MFILYYLDKIYLIDNYQYQLNPNNYENSEICNSKNRNERYENIDPFLVSSGKLIKEDDKFIINVYNFRMIFLPKKNNNLIKMNKYNLDIQLELVDWILTKKSKKIPVWSGFTIFYNYHSSDNHLCISFRNDNYITIKKKIQKNIQL